MDEKRQAGVALDRAASEISRLNGAISELEHAVGTMEEGSSLHRRYSEVLEGKREELSAAQRTASEAHDRLMRLNGLSQPEPLPEGLRRSVMNDAEKAKFVAKFGLENYVRLPR